FKAFRTIPVILDIVRDMEELCPNAWLINFTNPAGMVTEAVHRYTKFHRVIGLCNVPIGMKNGIAKLLNVEPNTIQMEIVGLNHHFYVTNVWSSGIKKKAHLPEIYQNLKDEDYIGMKNIMTIPCSKALIRGLHAIPCPY